MISIIIVNYHCAALTVRAVKSVINEPQKIELWVVDNSVNIDQASQLKKELPQSVNLILNDTNKGFGRACNQAYKLSHGEFVLLLNPDAYLLPGSLTLLADQLQASPKIAAVGPQIYWTGEKQYFLPPSLFPSPWRSFLNASWRLHPICLQLYSLLWRFYALKIWQSKKSSLKVTALSGGHILLKRSAIEVCGGLFHEQYFMYYEDSDLMLRLKQANYQLCVIPKAACVHNYEHSTKKITFMVTASEQYFKHNYNKNIVLSLLKYLPKKSFFNTKNNPIMLGEFHDSPLFSIPKLIQKKWLFEISPSPHFIPSIGLFGTGDTIKIPKECTDFLHSSAYFCRVSSPDSFFNIIRQWQWEKI
jgi:GT2 family glycosyltransferase